MLVLLRFVLGIHEGWSFMLTSHGKIQRNKVLSVRLTVALLLYSVISVVTHEVFGRLERVGVARKIAPT